MNRSIAFLLAINMEAVMLVVGAWTLGDWLNENYPFSHSWYAVTFPIACIIILHSFYVVFKTLLRINADQEKNKKA